MCNIYYNSLVTQDRTTVSEQLEQLEKVVKSRQNLPNLASQFRSQPSLPATCNRYINITSPPSLFKVNNKDSKGHWA